MGVNCVAAMKFEISGVFFSDPLKNSRGGGGFLTPGGFFRLNFNSKNHNFSDDFHVIFGIFILCCFIK